MPRCTGAEGGALQRIQRLEAEVQLQRNRAAVNAMFRDEHDRLASELVSTKVLLAEAQEELSRVHRQQRSGSSSSINAARGGGEGGNAAAPGATRLQGMRSRLARLTKSGSK